MSSNPQLERKLFGIGVEDDEELQALQNSPHPKHPKSNDEKMERIMAYLEQVQHTTRDNNAILYQMLNTLEEKMDKKIEDLRIEMIELIKNTTSGNNTVAKAHRRTSSAEVRNKAEKYSAPAQSASASAPVMPPSDVFYDMVDITPEPGFVVKTRKLLGEHNKVFINIFHHNLIALNPPGMSAEQAKDKPYLMMEAPTCSVDRAGVDCLTFNVGISNEYFIQPNSKVDINITAPATIYKVDI